MPNSFVTSGFTIFTVVLPVMPNTTKTTAQSHHQPFEKRGCSVGDGRLLASSLFDDDDEEEGEANGPFAIADFTFSVEKTGEGTVESVEEERSFGTCRGSEGCFGISAEEGKRDEENFAEVNWGIGKAAAAARAERAVFG